MAKVTFRIEDNDMLKVEEAIKDYGENAEKTINDYLVNEAGNIFKHSITNLIPVSDKQKRNHAKNSDPFEAKQENNLSLTIKTKKQYHYLYFPNEGEGTSKDKAPQLFDERGVEKEYDNVVNGILDRLQKNL